MESIKVLRRQETETKEIKVGDQILVSLVELGDFTATAHKIADKGILFIFDEYVTSRPMNSKNTNEGGYEESDLKDWFDSVLLEAFPDELRSRIANLSIPSIGELFGHDDKWVNAYFELDEDKQLALMKKQRNRIAYFNNEWVWGWLRNRAKKNISSTDFAYVGCGKSPNAHGARCSLGVRPEFWMIE